MASSIGTRFLHQYARPTLGPRCRSCIRSYATRQPERHTLASTSRLVRPIGSPTVDGLEGDFALYPRFYSSDETKTLLEGALWKLDRVDPTRKRRRRSQQLASAVVNSSAPLQDLFSGPYGFEEGHYDSVIHDYRETTISTLPPASSHPGIAEVLNRAYRLLPGSPQISGDVLPPETITHLLHLAPSGTILAHIDNLQASGSVIMGICFGSSRILRLTKKTEEGEVVGWDVLLENGSVYLQQDKLRYEYEHAILGYDESSWDGAAVTPGHRMSIMVRDTPSKMT